MFSSFFRGRRESQPQSRSRHLSFDSLEFRDLLTTLAPLALPTDPPVDNAVTAVVVASSSSPTPPAALEGEGDDEPVFNQQSPQSGTPPTITYFTWEMDGSNYIFSGYVTDDKPVEQITVYFGGLVSGTTQVCTGGYFSLGFTWGTQIGYVTAQAQDGDGLWSNIKSEYIA